MITWTQRTTAAPKVVFERALGLNELQFYHRGHVLSGATDSIQAIAFEFADERHHVSEEMIRDAWIAIKHKFPLLGAYIEVLGPLDEDIHFVVDTDLLKSCSPGEVMSLPVSSEAEVKTVIDKIINGARLLHDRRLVQLFILKRLDRDNIYHLLIHGAHCMTDGISHHAAMRALLDILSSPSPFPAYSLQERLALSVPTENVFPIRHASLAKQRWQKAIGHVIHTLRLKTTVVSKFSLSFVVKYLPTLLIGRTSSTWSIHDVHEPKTRAFMQYSHVLHRKPIFSHREILSETRLHVWQCISNHRPTSHGAYHMSTVRARFDIRRRMGVSQARAYVGCRSSQYPAIPRPAVVQERRHR